jgi:PAS domain-containing protein
MIDNQDRIKVWNPAAELMFGYSFDHAKNIELHRLIVPSSYYERYKIGFNKFIKSVKGPAINNTVELRARIIR